MPTIAWTLILLVFALVLFVLEILSPGFGLPGVAGILLLAADVLITARSLQEALIYGLIAVVIVLIFLLLGARLISRGRLPKRLILDQGEEDYRSTEDLSALLGTKGTAVTVLRPAGLAELGGRRLDVVTRGEFLEKGSPLEVVETAGGRIVVRACPDPALPENKEE
jgi:membrane-bound serine protease (ClpP class)